ncbi:MAG: DUF998 domain-containing protein [Streptosporangiaceae bacterium]
MAAIQSPALGTEHVRSAGRATVVAGGACWAVGVVQYAAAQIVAADAWTRPYSLKNNYLSDLGNTACGMFHVPHGTPYNVCSPSHAVMNASFIIFGVLTIAGALLLRRIWPAGRLARWALILWVLSGLGKIIVGIVPENTHIGLHLIGALNVPVESVAILLLSLAIRRNSRLLAAIGIAAAVVGLAGSFLSTAGQYAGSSLYLGLGVGGAERLASYPGTLWMLMMGITAMAFTRTWLSFRYSLQAP